MGSTNLTSEKKSDILKMRAQGHSFRKIAEALNVGKQTAVDVCKECEEELSALRALEWEELYEKERLKVQELETLLEEKNRIIQNQASVIESYSSGRNRRQ